MIQSVEINKSKRLLNLSLKDGQCWSYPWIWLRDNCRCSDCIWDVTEARKTQIKDLDLSCKLDDAQVTIEGKEVMLRWGDDHKSTFAFDYLKENRFTKDGMRERKHFSRLTPKTWGKEMLEQIVKLDFNKFMTDDATTYKYLVAVEQSGLALLQNAPLEERTLTKIADRVNSWLRPQHHGNNFKTREIFNIRTDMKQTSDVYTSGRLNYHTDLSFCQFPPSMQMLHCLKQTPTKGGDSIFADGFYVANKLRDENEDLFKVLTQIPVSSNDFGGYYYDFNFVWHGTTIQLDVEGDLESIRFANHARYCALNAPIDRVEMFYKAYQRFEALMEENHIEFKLKEGEIVCFDNVRVLHGRLPFEMSYGSRHLDGSYIEWDDLRSARRVLQLKLNENP